MENGQFSTSSLVPPLPPRTSVEKNRTNTEFPMGHRLSKSASAANTTSYVADINRTQNNNNNTSSSNSTEVATITSAATPTNDSNRIPISLPAATINVQIQESPTTTAAAAISAASSSSQLSCYSDNNSLSSLHENSYQHRQIIIKIQLAKMENGNETQALDLPEQQQQHIANESNALQATVMASDPVESSSMTTTATNGAAQFVNLTLNRNYLYGEESKSSYETGNAASGSNRTSSGCSSSATTNNNTINTCSNNSSSRSSSSSSGMLQRLNSLQMQETNPRNKANKEQERALDIGCLNARRKCKAPTTPSTSLTASTGRRCRDAFKRILEPSSMKSNKSKEHNKKHSANSTTQPNSSNTVLTSSSSLLSPCTSSQRRAHTAQRTHSTPQTFSTASVQPTTTTHAAVMTTATTNVPISIATTNSSCVSIPTTNPLSAATIWTPSRNDLIIPITSPQQFVVVQCAPSSLVTLGRIDDNSIRLTSTELGSGNNIGNSTVTANTLLKTSNNGLIVHSQVDFVHCLVPDLDKITQSSFYWGKIDRYEAERLLEGKPEGTFLLRDSAQEEYLFSVTFRKYGRSLHARIEQSGHKFSFDCHDPCVFTAPTVTGLLQHYKDPACVMFFEPMLTIPLHRKSTFTLQELARAVIASNTTYDGINELGLPVRLKSFLKEYHYKQKLRVKPFDEPFYACT